MVSICIARVAEPAVLERLGRIPIASARLFLSARSRYETKAIVQRRVAHNCRRRPCLSNVHMYLRLRGENPCRWNANFSSALRGSDASGEYISKTRTFMYSKAYSFGLGLQNASTFQCAPKEKSPQSGLHREHHPADWSGSIFLVPRRGLEPPRCCHR